MGRSLGGVWKLWLAHFVTAHTTRHHGTASNIPCVNGGALRTHNRAFPRFAESRNRASPKLPSTPRYTSRPMKSKVYETPQSALDGLTRDGITVAVGGFGLCGIPEQLILALRDSGATGLTAISNNAGVDDWGLGLLLATRQIRRMVSSYVGENAEFERQYMAGELELEFNPQGTLAERMRAGGAGIAGFFTKTGVGTIVAQGKETKEFDGETYVLERGIRADLSLVKAWKADESGNLVFRKTARNFNPMVAMCGRVCVAEVEEIVATGSLDPDHIHTPGIYVDRIVRTESVKRIEQRTVRAR